MIRTETIPFPKAGWARNRIKPRQRIVSLLSRWSKKKPASVKDKLSHIGRVTEKKRKP